MAKLAPATDVRLGLPVDAVEPSLRAYLDQIERINPAPLRPSEGQDGLADRIVAIDDARFVPLRLSVPGLVRTVGIVTTVGLLLAIAVGVVLLLLLEWSVVSAMAVTGVLMVATLGVVIAIDQRKRSGGRCTGVLCLADRLVVCYPSTVSVFPRAAMVGIVERMHAIPGNEHQGPKTGYRGVVVYRDIFRAADAELILIEEQAHGEAGLTIESNHAEGRFVGAVVRYLVREWLGAEPLSSEPHEPRPRRDRARARTKPRRAVTRDRRA